MRLRTILIFPSIRHAFTVLLCFLALVPIAQARELIRVGLAHFPPYIEARDAPVRGLAADMLTLMNEAQNLYEFVPVITNAAVRHREFSVGRHDMSMFDNLNWGWAGYEVDATQVYLTGGEIYIAQAMPDRDESFFSNFENKKMIGMLGYHYSFAGYNSDIEYLRARYGMELTQSNRGSIQMVLAGNRGDIAVVTKAFLNQYLDRHPHLRPKLLISQKLDQEYRFSMIIRRGMRPTVDELNTLLDELNANGQLPALWKQNKAVMTDLTGNQKP